MQMGKRLLAIPMGSTARYRSCHLSPPLLSLSLSVSLSRRPILISFALLLCALLGMCCQDTAGAAERRVGGHLGRVSSGTTHTTHSFSHSVWGNAHFWVRSSRPQPRPQLSSHFRLGGLLIVPTDIRHIRKSIKIKRAAAEGAGRGGQQHHVAPCSTL